MERLMILSVLVVSLSACDFEGLFGGGEGISESCREQKIDRSYGKSLPGCQAPGDLGKVLHSLNSNYEKANSFKLSLNRLRDGSFPRIDSVTVQQFYDESMNSVAYPQVDCIVTNWQTEELENQAEGEQEVR